MKSLKEHLQKNLAHKISIDEIEQYMYIYKFLIKAFKMSFLPIFLS